mgnify:FL=1
MAGSPPASPSPEAASNREKTIKGSLKVKKRFFTRVSSSTQRSAISSSNDKSSKDGGRYGDKAVHAYDSASRTHLVSEEFFDQISASREYGEFIFD